MVSGRSKFRFADLAANRVVRALALSLFFHFFVFAVAELGFRLGWWKDSLLASLLLTRKVTPSPNIPPDLSTEMDRIQREVPVVFVEVDPRTAVEEAPKDARYYSTQNSQAANREVKVDSNLPNITGNQDRVPKTTDQPLEKKLQPQPPAPEPEPKPEPLQPNQPEPAVASGPQSGEMNLAKASEAPKPNVEEKPEQKALKPAAPTRPRPRTLAAARQQQQQPGMVGERMKQEGGVKRRLSIEGLDVKASPFGAYDAALIAAIQQRWYDLLDERDYARSYSGKVVLTFRLNSDGRITEMRVAENEVSEILALICQRAVQDPSPYLPWPNDMRRLIGAEFREVRFTFYYN